MSLAGSLFFSLSPEASQQQILLYLVINLAPYMLLAPLVGPAIDRLRHGPRNIAVFLFGLRAVCAAGLALTLLDLGFYFFALALLMGAKATGVTCQALVPGLVDDPSQLVAANSRLARLSVIAGTVGGVIGAGLLAISTPAAAAGLAGVLFVAAAIATTRVPDPVQEQDPVPASVVYEELHGPTIVATAWAFTVVRASVGFFVFGLAFALRRESEPAWMYGATVALYGAGTFAGNVVAAGAAAALRRGPPDGGVPRRAGRRRRVRRPRAVTTARAAGRGGARRGGVGRPSGLRRTRPDAGPVGHPRPRLRPLRDALPGGVGDRGDRGDGDRDPDPDTAWPSSPSA